LESHPDAFVIGGAVRDLILGKLETADLDLAIAENGIAASERIASTFGRGVTFVPLDRNAGVGRLVVWKDCFATIDIGSFKGSNISEDLLHRDFTINAMAISLKDFMAENPRNIIDPLGGQADLSQAVLRICSPKSFSDDPLRILRAFRFTTLLDLTMTPQTSGLLAAGIPELSSVAPERLRDEFFFILCSKNASTGLAAMESHGIFDVILPELVPSRGFLQNDYHHLDVLRHSLETVRCLETILEDLPVPLRDLDSTVSDYVNEEPVRGRPRRGLLKLAALLHDSGKPHAAAIGEDGRLHFIGHEKVSRDIARQIMARLRMSRRERDSVELWVGGHMRASLFTLPTISLRAMRNIVRDFGNDVIGLTLLVLADTAATRGPATTPKEPEITGRGAAKLLSYYLKAPETSVKLFLNGTDLIQHLGMKQGPEIGRILRLLADMQEDGIITSREEALAEARKFLPSKVI
ncbi:MAG: poly(A) polymerase, partial [Thermodesulfobacteriota bacterium]|nr:poly(A) polymerase [Thermodesulfobacteriota bacterium]